MLSIFAVSGRGRKLLLLTLPINLRRESPAQEDAYRKESAELRVEGVEGREAEQGVDCGRAATSNFSGGVCVWAGLYVYCQCVLCVYCLFLCCLCCVVCMLHVGV